MRLREPTYLGDGVYARFDPQGQQVWIWATDGVMKTAEIALNPSTMHSLVSYHDSCFSDSKINGG